MENILIAPQPEAPDWATKSMNLADERLGAVALACSDDFFAPMTRMLQSGPATFVAGKYDEHGKWMDGWESRRKRGPGHDWCIVQLARPASIIGIDIDTSFFTGNFPPAASLEACYCETGQPDEHSEWHSLMPATRIAGNFHNFFTIADRRVWTHVRLNIMPDGGVARLRVYGRPVPAWARLPVGSEVDLVAIENGGRAIAWNDAHFGAAANLLLPGTSLNMGDGWETRRRREPGHDWCILALGTPGEITRVEVHTTHFKGNFPDRVSIQAAYMLDVVDQALPTQSLWWPTLLPERALRADAAHHFALELEPLKHVSHVRLNIFPDGGVARLRLWGKPDVGQ